MNPNPPSSTELPHRFRFTSVQQYEDVIHQAVEKYPQVCQFDPRPRALATFAARLRDAMLSLKKYQWPGLKIDLEKFNSIHDDLQVSEREGTCFVGSRAILKLPQFKASTEPPKLGQLIVHGASDSVLRSLCVLCQHRILPEQQLPIRIIGAHDPAVIIQLELLYDVAFEKTTEGYNLV